MHDVFCPITGDLAGVRERMNRYYKIRAGEIKEFAHLEKYAEKWICPALVLYAARINGKVTEKVVSLAAVFQFIYQAMMIHHNINEDCQIRENACADPRDGCQYPVLAGDYLYGRFFTTLCEWDIVKYLGPLSEIICMINEGSIKRLKCQAGGIVNPAVRREIVRLEMAELMAGCCRMGGEEAGADRETQQCLSGFGSAVGMALGMVENEWPDQAEKYFREAMAHLEMLAPGSDRENLRGLVMHLMNRVVDSKKMVG
ncbi:MAG: polyprenyl synthetase family protein [Peptococcaceae bacterium]|nr:polyprenyl synthetase family protein [Peptococcaceae bacterium]